MLHLDTLARQSNAPATDVIERAHADFYEVIERGKAIVPELGAIVRGAMERQAQSAGSGCGLTSPPKAQTPPPENGLGIKDIGNSPRRTPEDLTNDGHQRAGTIRALVDRASNFATGFTITTDSIYRLKRGERVKDPRIREAIADALSSLGVRCSADDLLAEPRSCDQATAAK